MKVHHTLICLFFFLSLQDGNTGLVNAQITVYSRIEGQDLRIQCSFSSGGSRMYFCKETCRENILIDTTGVRDQRGRYNIEYEETSQGGDVFVTITNLMKSDSGLYWCGLIEQENHEYHQIEIIVVDAVLQRNPPEEKTLYTRTGGNIVVECSFTSVGSRKYFCRDDCKEKDILVETTRFKVQKGRYSIEFIKASTGGSVYVSVTQLNQSDSGRYRCAMDRSSRDSYREFKIMVTDDRTTSGPDSVQPASSVPSVSTPTTTTKSFSSEQETEPPPTTGLWLYVGLTLAVLVVLLSLAVLIYCRKKSAKPNDPPGETENTSVTEINRVYEDIREDRHSRSPPVEISSSHTYAKYTTPSGAETNDYYSSVTAARSQDTAEDDSSKLTYSEVNFSNRTVGSSSGVIRGDGGDVVYSVPRTQPSSDASRAKDDVYSTVT